MKREAAYVLTLAAVLVGWVMFYKHATAGTNNPDMVVTLVSPKTGVVYSNTIQLIATVSFKSQLPAPTILAIK